MKETSDLVRRFADETWRHARSSLYRNAILLMLAYVVSQGLGFFFWLVVARFYTASDVGYAIALYQTLSFLATLATLGLGTGIVRYLPETEDKPLLVNTAATLCGVAALLLAIFFIAFVGFLTPDLSFILDTPIYPIAVIAATVVLTLIVIFDQVSCAVRRADVLTLRVVVFSVAKIPLAICLAFVPFTEGHLGVFMALAIALALGVLVEMFYLLPRVIPGFRPRPRRAFSKIRPMLRFSLDNQVASAITAASSLLLPILILNVLGPSNAEDVAFFYVASIVAGLLSVIPSSVFTSFYAEASQKNADRSADEYRAIVLSILLLVPGMAVLWLFSEEVLMWFGDPTYARGAVDTLRILVFASVPSFVNDIMVTRLRIRRMSTHLIIGATISTATILILGIVLLQTHGINGLAVATVLGKLAATPYYYAVARRSFRRGSGEPGWIAESVQ